jgi:hypothetical protein
VKTSNLPIISLMFLLTSASTPMLVTADEDTSLTSMDTVVSLRGCHAITLRAGLLNRAKTEAEVSGEGVTTETSTNGFSGSLSYEYWVKQEVSVGVDVGLIAAESATSAGAGGVTSKSAAVIPVLFGIAYYPKQLALSPTMRPGGSLAVGAYVGSASNTQASTTVGSESVIETVLGLRVRAGVDWFLGDWFKLGISAGYHFVSEFDEQIGSERDYSGPEFSFGIGVLLGKAK